MPGVKKVIPVSAPYKQVSLEWKGEPTVVTLPNGARIGGGEQRQVIAAFERARVPQRLPPVEAQRPAGIRIGEQTQGAGWKIGFMGQFLNGSKGPRGSDFIGPCFAKSINLTEAEAEAFVRSNPIIPIAVVYIYCPHLDAMFPCITHQLCGRIKAHRLRIEDCCCEYRRVMAFNP